MNEVLDLINTWFQALRVTHKRHVPATFDFELLFRAIDTLLDLEDLLGCDKCLWFIYNVIHLLPRTKCYHHHGSA